LLKLKSLSHVATRLRTVCDGVIKDGRREERSMSAALSGCINDNEICFVCIEPKSIVYNSARDITETVT